MKLISLNIWGGKRYKPLLEFIKKQSADTDIFCFQEVFKTNSGIIESHGFRLNLFDKISKVLPDYQGYFAICVDNYIAGAFLPKFEDFDLSWGLAIFIKKKLKVTSSGDFFVFRKRNQFDPKDLNTLPRNLQYISFIDENGKNFTVANLHGIWRKEGKNDSLSRLSQSNQINEFFDKVKGGKILVGDFNLNPDTESIKILEKNMTNLIKQYNIQATRNKFYPGWEKFADYIFVSKEINVSNFQVPYLEISDHLPMILEFS